MMYWKDHGNLGILNLHTILEQGAYADTAVQGIEIDQYFGEFVDHIDIEIVDLNAYRSDPIPEIHKSCGRLKGKPDTPD